MLTELDTYDWREAFVYADPYTIEDVVKIIVKDEGENDGPDWIGIFEVSDGKFILLRAGCDYTGWDCQAGGRVEIFDTLAQTCSKISLTMNEIARLGKELLNNYKYELDWAY